MNEYRAQNESFDALMADLRSHDGSTWKETRGEFQTQYLELAIWILLYDDYDLDRANEQVWSYLLAHQTDLKPFAPFVSYLKADYQLGLVETSTSPGGWTREDEAEIDWRKDGPTSIFKATDSSHS